MKKRVKNGIEKHYCDKCGVNIYDHVPKKTQTLKIMGLPVIECDTKRHCDFRIVFSKPYGEYCLDCYNELNAK